MDLGIAEVSPARKKRTLWGFGVLFFIASGIAMRVMLPRHPAARATVVGAEDATAFVRLTLEEHQMNTQCNINVRGGELPALSRDGSEIAVLEGSLGRAMDDYMTLSFFSARTGRTIASFGLVRGMNCDGLQQAQAHLDLMTWRPLRAPRVE